MIGNDKKILVNREINVNIEEDINEVINNELEKVITAKAEELGKKYFRNIAVKFGAKIK